MLSKKAIAAFAAGATLVSGLALAVPTIANAEDAAGQGQQNQPSFHDKFEANKVYVYALEGKGPDGKTKKTYTEQELEDLKAIATSKDPEATKKQIEDRKAAIEALAQKAEHKGLKDVVAKIRAAKTVKAAQDLLVKAEKAAKDALTEKAKKQHFADYIVDRIDKAKTIEGARALYAEVMKARGDMPAPVVDEPVDNVTVAPEKEEEPTNPMYITEDPDELAERLELESNPTFYKTEDPDAMAQRLVKEAAIKAAIEAIAKQAEKEGFTFVAKQIRKAKTVEGAQALLQAARDSKKKPEPKPVPPTPAINPAIEAIAKQAEKEGFTFVAKYIRKAKTIEGARALYAEVMKARGDMPAPVVDEPVDNVTVAPEKEEEPTNPMYITEDPDELAERLELESNPTFYKTEDPDAMAQRLVKEAAIKAAIEAIAKQAEKEGFTFAAKQIRKAKTVEGAQALLQAARDSKKKPEPKPVPPTPAINPAIEAIAKQAEKEGFTFVAKYIRKAKTVEGARALLAEAEKGKKPTPTPVPPAPKPTPTPTPTPVPPAPKPTPTPTPTPVPPAPKPTPTPTPTPVPPAPVPTPEPKIEHKLDLVDLLGGKKAEEPTFVSPDGSENLFTNYKGLTVVLAKHGLTNVAAYDALLDKLEFGLKQTGWANILKNFGGDNCAYLGKLRNQLKKAVAHYGHVEAAVKDILAELNADYKDAQKAEDWDAAKVIKADLAAASKLLKVADNNRTRAAAILDSANDHAKDLSCDTGAQEVLDAMKKAGNFPGKAAAKAPVKKHAAAAPLAKTGAAVALAAVAASVLAGMGAALRKIRH